MSHIPSRSVFAPNFAKMLRVCRFTVSADNPKWFAISLRLAPEVKKGNISCSLGVNLGGGCILFENL